MWAVTAARNAPSGSGCAATAAATGGGELLERGAHDRERASPPCWEVVVERRWSGRRLLPPAPSSTCRGTRARRTGWSPRRGCDPPSGSPRSTGAAVTLPPGARVRVRSRAVGSRSSLHRSRGSWSRGSSGSPRFPEEARSRRRPASPGAPLDGGRWPGAWRSRPPVGTGSPWSLRQAA